MAWSLFFIKKNEHCHFFFLFFDQRGMVIMKIGIQEKSIITIVVLHKVFDKSKHALLVLQQNYKSHIFRKPQKQRKSQFLSLIFVLNKRPQNPTVAKYQVMDHDNMHNLPPPSSSMANQTNPDMMMTMHMTFFWGKNTEVLFSGWPGTSSGMYALSLIVVFVIAVITEWLAHSPILRGVGSTSRASGIVQTALYTFRIGLSYLVMLAVMSFNGGIFIVAMAGFAVGFLLFGSTTFKKPSDDQKTDKIPPLSSGSV